MGHNRDNQQGSAVAAVLPPGLNIDSNRVDALIAAARDARRFAYAPYSHLRVGAALLGENERIYAGCNVENASFGLTNCAERTALYKAVSEGERRFQLLVLTSDHVGVLTPCGACRQVLAEFALAMPVLMIDDGGQRAVMTVAQLLPGAFVLPGSEECGMR